ncbi:MAG: universal stress protein [Actinomycetota bacterium]|nr:universal stress protein [Actinomycetota bacterium]
MTRHEFPPGLLGSTSEQLVRHGECPVTVGHGSRPWDERR